MAKSRTKSEPGLLRRLRKHVGCDPAALPVVEQHFEPYQRPNLHLALEELFAEPDRQADLVGLVVLEEYHAPSLARLSRAASAKHFDAGPVEYIDVALPADRQLACVKQGMYLVREDGEPLAVLLAQERFTHKPTINVEVMAPDRERAERFVRRLTRLTWHGKAYRGHVLSLERDCYDGLNLQFHRLPRIGREEIILPETLLRRIERHTLSFSRHAERLRAAQRHLKRGILLHGAPGAGKTLSAMYLASQMPDRHRAAAHGRRHGFH